MSHDKLSEYQSYRETTKRLLLIVGLWPGEKPGLLCRLFVCLILVLCTGIVMAMSGYVRMHISNVAAVTKTLGIMVSYVTVILKLTWMFINRENVFKLHQMLDPHFIDLLNHPELSHKILRGVTTFRRLHWMLTVLIITTTSIYAVTPLAFVIYQHLRHVQNIKYILVYPAVYPWAITPNGLLYKFHYFCESTPNIALSCVTAGVDSLFTLHVFQMIAQLREMSYRIMQIDKKENNQNIVCACVTQHKNLIDCRDILEKVYGPMILWIMITNGIILCSLTFQLSQIKSMSILRGVMFTTYLGLKLTQTLMYAWAGTCLTEESENYIKAIYAADWYSNRRIMTSILIMLGQRPLVLTACKFSVVSIDIFMMVLNTTASYFFLLRTIQNED